MRRSCTAPLLTLALLASAAPAGGQARSLAPGAAQQIRALLADKEGRSPAQRKIGSQLLYTARMRRGLAAAPGVSALRTDVDVDAEGRALVDLHADVTPRLLAQIGALGGSVASAHPGLRSVRARVPLGALEAIAELDEVGSLRPADRAYTRAIDVSRGDVAHRADAVRSTYGVDGTGVRVGVLSDGVASLSSLEASGDLPPSVTVLPGQAGSGSEGTAMLEIVHDLAPGAQLLFATAFNGQASFASNIQALRQAGADIIVDDVGYFAEAVLQDDNVAAAVDAVVADGALYFSAAGNDGSVDHAAGGTWEGDFVDSGTLLNGKPAADFGGGVVGNAVTRGSTAAYTLHWSDPKWASGNDYDLFLLDASMTTIIAASTNEQNGNDAPLELIGALASDVGDKLVVVKHAGQARFLHLDLLGGRLAITTPGAIGGHPGARSARAVAAVDVRSAGGPGGTFDGSEAVQFYSSDGPRRIFYEADGTPITPGNVSSTGGELRAKPDLAAADCVHTATPGFSTFCGTSAAAPHAAAIAALLWQLGHGAGATAGDIGKLLEAGALDIEAPGPDRDAGSGLAAALASADAMADSCHDGIDNDGDGLVDLADPGCASPNDPSERNPAAACDDGKDNDGDGLIDYPADPGCFDATPYSTESPACQNGLDDDGDGGIDFDGGAAANHGVALGPPDPQCTRAVRNFETPNPCGLGAELAPLLPLLAWLRRRRLRTP
jgi:hypothetical protein